MLSRLFSTVLPSSFSLAFRSFGACPAVHRWADHHTPLSYEAAQAEANRCLLCHDVWCYAIYDECCDMLKNIQILLFPGSL